MSQQDTDRPYKALGDVLLQALGATRTVAWLAKRLYVTPVAAHNWVSGKRRPQPGILGQLAALLTLNPEHLAFLAGYDTDPSALEKVLNAYHDRLV